MAAANALFTNSALRAPLQETSSKGLGHGQQRPTVGYKQQQQRRRLVVRTQAKDSRSKMHSGISGGATLGPRGYTFPDRKCLPRPAASGTVVSSYFLHGDNKSFLDATVLLKGFPVYNPRRLSICNASPNNHRRNPDFSRQQKGSSKGKSRQFQERENSENLEETDFLPSKNGPLSVSANQRYQAAATPGRREKEIVELFRKVQAQLRARAAIKEEKKMEASQSGQGDRGTVDSLLKLLRKHSIDQKRKNGDGKEDSDLDQAEKNNPLEEEQNSNFFRTNIISSEEVHQPEEVCQPDPIVSSRPASNFRRRSPVPRVKFQPVFSAEEDDSSDSTPNSEGQNLVVDELDQEPLSPDGPDDVFSVHPSDASHLGSLKLSELRDLAKSRGVKGYSKLKKGELVELLIGNDA